MRFMTQAWTDYFLDHPGARAKLATPRGRAEVLADFDRWWITTAMGDL